MWRPTPTPLRLLRKAVAPSKRSSAGIGKNKRAAVVARSGGQCEADGCLSPGTEVHHVKPRCIGGGNELENLMHVCRPCHRRLDREAIPPLRNPGLSQKPFAELPERLADF